MKLFWTFGSTLESNYNKCWLHLPSSAKNAFSRATLLSTNTSLLYFSRYLYLSIYFSDSFFIFTATNICTFYFWHFLFHSHSRWIWIILILCCCAPPSQHHKSHCVLWNWQQTQRKGNKDVKHRRCWNRYKNVEKRRVRVSYLQYPCSPLTGLSYFSHSIFAVRLPTMINITWASGGFA